MTYVVVVLRLMLGFLVLFFVFTGVENYGAYKNEAGYTRGVQESIGRPMKYSQVPIGEYTVVEVVEKYKPYTVVVRRGNLAVGYLTPEYLLVTDMMPNMMEEHFTFAIGGNTK